MRGAVALLYGAVCYLLFFLVFLYAIAFVGDAAFVPHTLDRGLGAASVPQAVVIDAVLLGIFAIQHSGMARRGFKAWLTRWMAASTWYACTPSCWSAACSVSRSPARPWHRRYSMPCSAIWM